MLSYTNNTVLSLLIACAASWPRTCCYGPDCDTASSWSDSSDSKPWSLVSAEDSLPADKNEARQLDVNGHEHTIHAGGTHADAKRPQPLQSYATLVDEGLLA